MRGRRWPSLPFPLLLAPLLLLSRGPASCDTATDVAREAMADAGAEQLLAGLPGWCGEDDNDPAAGSRREKCARCSKPAKVRAPSSPGLPRRTAHRLLPQGRRLTARAQVCLCSVLPANKLATPHVKVLVLQHPEEAGSAKSTVTLMQLCLADCRVVTGRKFRQVVGVSNIP
jgi:hypothetical protein